MTLLIYSITHLQNTSAPPYTPKSRCLRLHFCILTVNRDTGIKTIVIYMKHTTVYNIHFISCLYGNTMDCTAASSLAENCSWFFIDSTLLLSEHPLDSESNLLMCALLHVCVRPSIIFGGAGGKPPKMWNSSTYRLILSHCICPLMLKMCIIVLYYLNTLLRKYYCFEFFLKNRRERRIYIHCSFTMKKVQQ